MIPMDPASPTGSRYWRVLREPAVWRRTAKLGLAVGFVQVALNQGDHWLHGEVTRRLIIKSISSILFAAFVVLLASVSTRAESPRPPSS